MASTARSPGMAGAFSGLASPEAASRLHGSGADDGRTQQLEASLKFRVVGTHAFYPKPTPAVSPKPTARSPIWAPRLCAACAPVASVLLQRRVRIRPAAPQRPRAHAHDVCACARRVRMRRPSVTWR